MAASSTDKIRKKKSNFSTTLSSGIDNSTGTIPLSSSSGLPTDTAVTLTIDRVDANAVSTPSLMERVTGVVGVNQLTTATRGVEGSAQSHSAGAVVEDIWEAATWNDLCTAFLVSHAQTGNIKSGAQIDDTSADHQYVLAVSELAADRTVTLPLLLSADTFVFADYIQTLKNKTLEYPVIASMASANHNHQNVAGGGTLAEAALALTDVTTWDVTNSAHGFVPKATNNTANFLRADGAWAAPSTTGTYPAFIAGMSGNQTITASTWTKVQFDTEVLDTNTNYDPTTNYRFTPTVSGKYFIKLGLRYSNPAAGKWFYITIYKNGAEYRTTEIVTQGTRTESGEISAIVDFNGSTDYVEAYCWCDGTTPAIGGLAAISKFEGIRIS